MNPLLKTFYDSPQLKELLDDLVKKKYLKLESPKTLIYENTLTGVKTYRKENKNLSSGYNIVSGKLSYEINKILDPMGIAPTLVATDMARLGVVDGEGIRTLTMREGLRLFGYPEWFKMPVSNVDGFDLLGNTVSVKVVTAIAQKMADSYLRNQENILNCKFE